MHNLPISSYRLQLSKTFDLRQAENLLPYLKTLGVEMVYTSPCFAVVKGLNNPYMVISPHAIEPSLGGEEAFASFCQKCQELNLKHMMDIVPNHMAAHPENLWWKDVLEKGKKSSYAEYFDIDWDNAFNGITPLDTKGNIHEEINYRRFFDICEMVGLNIEKEKVYDDYFLKIKEFIAKGWVQGFRVDHIDGLKNPRVFLEKLARDFPETFIYLEKILQDGELIREGWPVEGSVGYDVLYLIDQVLLDKAGENPFTKLYEQYAEEDVDLAQIKRDYLNKYLISEMNRFSKVFGIEKKELVNFLAYFPNYRSYIEEGKPIDPIDQKAISYAADRARSSFFKGDFRSKDFVKLQQILPAVFAKGFEDTYNYRYVRLSSLNEVGGEPLNFSISNKRFHESILKLHQAWPYTMHTLSTHDTKRSLDARMRLHTLAEIPEEFSDWLEKAVTLLSTFESRRMAYFFLQSVIAISEEDIESRMIDYMLKASREGKYYSDYLTPNENFEKSLKSWVIEAFKNEAFLRHLKPFKQKISEAAEMKSLSALVLQFGLFGIMDLYQGEEFVNANLVDPDNRRALDFKARKESLKGKMPLKMEILQKGLLFRKEYKELLLKGSYTPIFCEEERVGYKREYQGQKIEVIVNKFHLGKRALLPPKVPQAAYDLFSKMPQTPYPFLIAIY